MLDSSPTATTPGPSSSASSLARRAVDNLFSRLGWFLVPVVLFAALGLSSATSIPSTYAAQGGLSAASNPFVGRTQVRGIVINDWETPAAGVARLINEQLRTDVFMSDVAERAGLGPALSAQLVTIDDIRENVGAGPSGQSNLVVGARWEDPAIAHALVEAIIEAYLDRVQELVTSDSNEAIAFWTELRAEAEARVEAAEVALDEFLASSPPPANGERSTEDQMVLLRLTNQLDRALASVNDAQSAIDSARLNLQQAQSEAGRQLQVVDPPRVPTSPQSTRMQALLTLVMFTGIGLVISAIAVVVSTLLDRSIKSEQQLASAAGVSVTASVGRIKRVGRWRRSETATAQPLASGTSVGSVSGSDSESRSSSGELTPVDGPTTGGEGSEEPAEDDVTTSATMSGETPRRGKATAQKGPRR
jgi:hypothetical protein